jgi:hypothetical protein
VRLASPFRVVDEGREIGDRVRKVLVFVVFVVVTASHIQLLREFDLVRFRDMMESITPQEGVDCMRDVRGVPG